jgi:glucose-6-phosphate 1-dehydrogenase
VLSASALAAARISALRMFKKVVPSTLERGQYDGYKSEPGVDPNSDTETFAGLKLDANGVPVYFWSGKALDSKTTEVCLDLKRLPRSLAKKYGLPANKGGELRLIIDDSDGPAPRFVLKIDGKQVEIPKPAGFSDLSAYSRVILLGMEGDNTGSPTMDEPIETWRILSPAVDAIKQHKVAKPFGYHRGVDGEEMAELHWGKTT